MAQLSAWSRVLDTELQVQRPALSAREVEKNVPADDWADSGSEISTAAKTGKDTMSLSSISMRRPRVRPHRTAKRSKKMKEWELLSRQFADGGRRAGKLLLRQDLCLLRCSLC